MAHISGCPHYIRHNNHPVDSTQEYLKRGASHGTSQGPLDQTRFHPMIESVLEQLIDYPEIRSSRIAIDGGFIGSWSDISGEITVL